MTNFHTFGRRFTLFGALALLTTTFVALVPNEASATTYSGQTTITVTGPGVSMTNTYSPAYPTEFTRFSVGEYGRGGGASGDGYVAFKGMSWTDVNGASHQVSLNPAPTIYESPNCGSTKSVLTGDPSNNQVKGRGNAADARNENYQSIAIGPGIVSFTFTFNRIANYPGDGSYWDLFAGIAADDNGSCPGTSPSFPIFGVQIAANGDGSRHDVRTYVTSDQTATNQGYTAGSDYTVTITLPAQTYCPGGSASLSASPTTGTTPLGVNFNLGASAGNGCTISAYSLDYGDGSAAQTGASVPATASHTYTNAGTFTAKLSVTATDGQGHSATTSAAASITAVPPNRPPVISSVSQSPARPVCNPLSTNALECDDARATASVTDPDGNLASVKLCQKELAPIQDDQYACDDMGSQGGSSYSWDFGYACAGTKISYYVEASDGQYTVDSPTRTLQWTGDQNLATVYCGALNEPVHQ